jgi:receptor protein-tyrosine kinase
MDMKRDFELSRVAPVDLRPLGEMHQRERTLGDILRDLCQLGDAEIARIATVQAERGLRFGEAAVSLRLARPADVDRALALQFGYLRVDPAEHPHLAELSVAADPHGAQAEVFRDLRAQIMLRPGGMRPAALAVVSPDGGDGRTHVAANLAVAFSQLGLRTVLVDADLRAPRLHRLFGLAPAPGLVAMLADRQLHGALDTPAALPGLHVLQVGTRPPNPLELLQRPPFAGLIAELVRKFDRVIVDTPAACGGADARVIAATCGQALLVGRRHHTAARRAGALLDGLRRERVDVVGVALNRH